MPCCGSKISEVQNMIETKYNAFDTPLCDVLGKLRGVTPDGKDNSHLIQVLHSMISHMKRDETFSYLYKDCVYAGNSYECLKIAKTTELDINMLFNWPCDVCEVIQCKKQPGYVKLKINWNESQFKNRLCEEPKLEKKLKKWTDKNGFLLRNCFKYWMQGLIQGAINNICTQSAEIKQRQLDRGFTIIVTLKEGTEYSINLVPAFLFSGKDWPQQPVRQLCEKAHFREWTVVPKEPRNEDEHMHWRMSFYQQEEEIINYLDIMKDVIKLIELFCDHLTWSDLHSYAIKTMFLWETENSKDKLWQSGLGNIFMHMLQKLSSHLTNGSVPYYWDERLNLLENMKDDRIKNINNRISQILKSADTILKENPHEIKKYFGYTSEEIEKSASKSSNSVHTNEHLSGFKEISAGSIFQQSASQKFKLQTEKINVDLQSTFGGNCNYTNDETSKEISSSNVEILLNILKEQRVIKEHLKTISEHYTEITQEINELRTHNIQLRNFLKSKTNENFSSTPDKTTNSLIDLEPFELHEQKCSHCGSPLPINKLKFFTSSPANILPTPTSTNNIFHSNFSLNSFAETQTTISTPHTADLLDILKH